MCPTHFLDVALLFPDEVVDEADRHHGDDAHGDGPADAVRPSGVLIIVHLVRLVVDPPQQQNQLRIRAVRRISTHTMGDDKIRGKRAPCVANTDLFLPIIQQL